jgi:hypothetical protein
MSGNLIANTVANVAQEKVPVLKLRAKEKGDSSPMEPSPFSLVLIFPFRSRGRSRSRYS